MTEAPRNSIMPDVVRALAGADFSGIAGRFAGAGFAIGQPARGILRICAPRVPAPSGERLSLLVSVGVHGDETTPIDMLALMLDELGRTPDALAVDLMVVVGNPDAIAQGKRFLDADLNRLFCGERGDLAGSAEARRADEIMRATQDFFGASSGRKWHLDLHTAIRPSLYPAFAIVPDVHSEPDRARLVGWLGGAGIDAVILNRKLAGTFSAYTATALGVSGCTAELGQIGTLGTNDLSQFAATRAALDALLRTGHVDASGTASPRVFRVAQEIVKLSDAFTMTFDASTRNFTALAPGAVIAEDGEFVYRVGAATEYVVFPNPNVRAGQRAGLMVVQV